MDDKKLFLLDAYALIYRAYYALIRAPRVTSKGLNTSAIFGFCNTLDEVLRKENPEYIAVCFDPPGGQTFRHEAYPEYKAQRDKQPEDITLSVPYIKRILDAYCIKVIEMPRYEADDVIGTLARRADAEGFTTYMMTPDKDYGQLVTDRVFMYRPSLRGQGFEVRGPKEVCERYGIKRPSQVIDLLALEGDASDNIPGCPGIGEKTAAKLIAEYDSVENLLANVASVKGANGRRLAENAEQVRFSKFLATIKTNIDIDVQISDLRRCEPNMEKLIEVFNELEFRSFVTKLTTPLAGETRPGSTARQPEAHPQAQPTADGFAGSLFDAPADSASEPTLSAMNFESMALRPIAVSTPSNLEEIGEVLAHAKSLKNIGIYISTSGDDDVMMCNVTALTIALSSTEACRIAIPAKGTAREEVLALVEPLFNACSCGDPTVISHDVKRDIILLKRMGINFTAAYYDTSIAHYLIQPEMKHLLDALAMSLLDYKVAEPGTKDADADIACTVLRLRPLLDEQLEQNNLMRLMNEIELPFVAVLAAMQYEGVRINTGELAALSVQLTRRLNDLETQAYELAGEAFNISSPMQVGEILFGKLKIDPSAKKTKRGAWSTTEEILEKHRATHPIVDIILKVRALRKLLSTYVDALPKLINPHTGKIHTSYNQTVTATGRISSTNPNLQNIPVRTEDGREIRRAFIPSPGNIMLSADYSQIELRLIADLSRDEAMIEAFHSGEDIHRATAAKIYHLPLAEVGDDLRRNAKTANFGIIYGISAFGLAERLGMSRSEAKALIEGYFATYPGVKKYMDNSIELAREQGYVSTVMGRRRMLPQINSRNAVVRGYAERNAINAPLQGSAADIIKRAMIDIDAEISRRGLRSRMIMQVHDELVFDVVPDELDELTALVRKLMEDAYHGHVHLDVSVGTGQNWLEAH